MRKGITTPAPLPETWDDPLMAVIRPAIREAIEQALARELSAVLGAARYERVAERLGYRNGVQVRELGTGIGAVTVAVPRARITSGAGASQEWRSARLGRYHRRLAEVDEAVVRIYLGGTNHRKIATTLRPLLTGVALSKFSRLVGQLQLAREAWMARRLDDEPFVYLYLDGFVVAIRRAGRVVRAPLLVAVGVRATGERVVVALQWATGATTLAWRGVLEQLASRGLRPPALCIMDGSPGLRAAVEAVWPTSAIQRGVVHKLRNLLAHAPHHSHAAVRADFHRMVYALSCTEAERAYARMLRHWQMRCGAVAQSLEDGGRELLTFFRFPSAQWKSIRSTNVIERVHEELRRRIKSQAAWSTEHGAVNLLYGLFAAGIVHLRRLDGFDTLAQPPAPPMSEAA